MLPSTMAYDNSRQQMLTAKRSTLIILILSSLL
jgi:hypothetical protein